MEGRHVLCAQHRPARRRARWVRLLQHGGDGPGRYPEGHTRRVAVGLIRPMPLPYDIASELNA